MSLVSLLTCIV